MRAKALAIRQQLGLIPYDVKEEHPMTPFFNDMDVYSAARAVYNYISAGRERRLSLW